ncbi:MAG: DUF1849 family protein [Alphaproteobacteria bacterium]
MRRSVQAGVAALADLAVAVLLVAAAALAPKEVRAEEAAQTDITPHRGIYRLELLRSRSSSGIIGTTGTAYFEWARSCEGYLVNQHVSMRLALAEGHASMAVLTFSSLESFDGRRMSFRMRQIAEGVVTEELEGVAELAADGSGVARFSSPEQAEIALPPGTLLPTEYTRYALAAMIAGKPLYSGTLFDGSTADGAYHVTTFFGAQTSRPVPGGKPGEEEPFWNSRAGYFEAGSGDAEPLFEVGSLVNAGGIAAWFDLDYGNFSVRAALAEYERLPDPSC